MRNADRLPRDADLRSGRRASTCQAPSAALRTSSLQLTRGLPPTLNGLRPNFGLPSCSTERHRGLWRQWRTGSGRNKNWPKRLACLWRYSDESYVATWLQHCATSRIWKSHSKRTSLRRSPSEKSPTRTTLRPRSKLLRRPILRRVQERASGDSRPRTCSSPTLPVAAIEEGVAPYPRLHPSDRPQFGSPR